MGLMKATSGLAKFTAVCGFWRHPSWLGADLDELGLWAAGISYCYEHGTDGHLPPRQSLAAGLSLPEKQVRRALEKLLLRGRWEDCVTFIEIVGFLDHNPSAREVMDAKARRSKAGKKGAEKRWQPDANANGNGNGDRNGGANSTGLDIRTNDAAPAVSGSRDRRPSPPPLERCLACDELTIDCACRQINADASDNVRAIREGMSA
jgi:hypothetical protein